MDKKVKYGRSAQYIVGILASLAFLWNIYTNIDMNPNNLEQSENNFAISAESHEIGGGIVNGNVNGDVIYIYNYNENNGTLLQTNKEEICLVLL